MISFFNILEFTLIFITFIIPPIFYGIKCSTTDLNLSYSSFTFILGIIAFLIFYIEKCKKNEKVLSTIQKFRIPLLISDGLIFFGLICVTSVVFEIYGYFFKGFSELKLNWPDTFFGYLRLISGTLCAAFYEEVIYRFYFPSALLNLLTENKIIKHTNGKVKLFAIISEVLGVVLFSLGHIYLGILGVLNSAVCGILLRICMKRTGTLVIPLLIHSIYNLLTFAAVKYLF